MEYTAVDWEEFRLLQHAQEQRYERAGVGGSKEDRDRYFGTGEMRGIGDEHQALPKEWIKHSREPRLEDTDPEFQEHWRGHELGRAHGRTGHVDNEELEREYSRSPHPEHFTEGYQEGLESVLDKHQTVAVLVSNDPGMRVVAHVSGNSIDVLHCPFCGSGAVIARSDGTIECGYCTSIFTVQVQPAYPGFPQSVDGQPYQWPGMPDPNSVMAPDAPPGTNVNPLQQGAPPLGDGGLLGVDGGPESSDPSEGGFGDEDGDDDSDDGNPFAKGSDDDGDSSDDKSDKGSDDKSKSKKKPPQKKSSSLILKTASGAQLDADEFEVHLAMKYAQNPLIVAQRVREARASGKL